MGRKERVAGNAGSTKRQVRTPAHALREASLRTDQLGFAQHALGFFTWIWDVERNEARWLNDPAALLGRPAGSWNGRFGEYLAQVHPDDRAKARQVFVACLKGELPSYHSEERLVLPDGSVHWIETYGRGFYDGDGRALRMTGVVRDITERKKSEQALATSEARLRAILDNTPAVAVQQYDAAGRILYWNRASEELYGYSAEQALGKTLDQLNWSRERAEQFRERLANIARSGRPFGPVEGPLTRCDGEQREIFYTLFALPDAEGGPRFVCMDVDITGRKRAERELRANRRLLEHVVDAIPMSIFAKDTKSNYIMLNQGMAEFFGLPKEELLQRHTSLLPNPYATVEKSLKDDAWVFDNRRTLDQPDTIVARPDGTLVHYHSTKIPLFDDAGELLGLLGVNRDITEQKRAEAEQRAARSEIQELNQSLERTVAERTDELRKANEDLTRALRNLGNSHERLLRSEKLAALGTLVAGVAHELNTPIGNSLLSATTLHEHTEQFATEAASAGLRRSALESYVAQAREASAILVRNLDKAAELIRSFKHLAVDQASSQRRIFQLHEVVQEVLLAHRPMLKRSPIEVATDIPAGIRLDGYPGPLGQVLGNLITNAVLHGYDGCPRGTVRVSARLDGEDLVEIAVRDQGRGISESDLKRIFDPFFTTRLGRGGTGLGLGICHNIVTEALGGSIDVASRLGEGSSFVLRLPLRAPGSVVRQAQ